MAGEAGLWLYDDQGRERFGPGTSNVTILGIINTGTTNGSVSNALLALGTPVIIGAFAQTGPTTALPTITKGGTTISWAFAVSGSPGNVPFRIIYGYRA